MLIRIKSSQVLMFSIFVFFISYAIGFFHVWDINNQLDEVSSSYIDELNAELQLVKYNNLIRNLIFLLIIFSIILYRMHKNYKNSLARIEALEETIT